MATPKSISRVGRICFVLFVMGCMLAIPPLQAAHAAGVLYAKPDGSGDCSSWANACTLQTALTGATSGDEIWVAAGTYKPTMGTDRTATFQLKDGVAIYGGFAGTETARDKRNPVMNVTILSGDLKGDDVGDNNKLDNVYNVVTGAIGATLDGFTISGGYAYASGANDPNDNGGGMYNASGSSPTLANIIFRANFALWYGGGMYNISGANPTLTNVTFSDNWTSIGGGGMYNESSTPTLINVIFSENSTYGPGGGIYNTSGSSPTLTNVTFRSNAANRGGGMDNTSGSSPTLINVTFGGNSVNFVGGGMENSSGSNPTLTNVTFSDNSVNAFGGGMYNDSSSPTLTNVTFSGNSTGNTGAGMYNTSGSSPVIRNTILWGNPAPPGGQIYNDGSTPILSDSVVQGGCPVGSTCTNIISADPLLGPLSNYGYGGFTETISLLPGSSAIDAGNDGVCPHTDQRGVIRPQGAHCDIGAYEYDHIVFHVHYVKPVASGTGTCSSWANACILQSALGTSISGDEIWAAAGTYKPTTNPTDRTTTFQLKDGVPIYGGFAGTETTRGQRNPGTNVTILSGDIDNNDSQKPVITDLTTVTGNTTNSYHVVTGATGATLDGFTITAGYAGGDSPNDSGAGIYNTAGSSPNLTNLIFSGNLATATGGGMVNTSGSNPTLTKVTFNGNFARESDNTEGPTNQGGGMYNTSSSPTLTNVTFSGNKAGYGGGMVNTSGSSPALSNVIFNENSGGYACGGMDNSDSSSNPTLTNVTFDLNTSGLSSGGGMCNTGNATLSNVTFSNNIAGYCGGGITNGGNPILTNVTFSDNIASTCGGGMYNTSGSSPTLTNVTFSGNSAQSGGGMDNNSGSPTIRNTIFWSNTASNAGGQIYNSASSSPLVSDSVLQDGYAGGANIIIADPLLGVPGNYGGFTQTIPLLPGSSAIDTGNDSVCPATDQRGISRPQGAHCDIGAFEVVQYDIFLPLVER